MTTKYDVYYTTWEDMPCDFQEPFIRMLSGSTAGAREFYRLYFYWYNIAHELAHILKHEYGTSKRPSGDSWQEEQEANDFAVAYWRHNHQGSRLQTLSDLLDAALSHLPDPVPAGAKPRHFFNENNAELGRQPAIYAYFQFSFVKNALKKTGDLLTVLRACVHPGANPPDHHLRFDYEAIDAGLPPRIVGDLRQAIAPFGLTLPSIDVIQEFYPMLQFVVAADQREEWLRRAADLRSS